jgi:F0F1-type ATP synthase assembly protein I
MIISLIVGLVIGFVAGALVFRNNAAKAEALVQKAKEEAAKIAKK